MILLVDNYDSFTYNLAHLIGICGASVKVIRNDDATVEAIGAMNPDGIVISPGPGAPDSAGVTLELIRRLGSRIPLLGVCLGHQAIGQAYGATVARHRDCVHGKASGIRHDGKDIFRSLENPFPAGRYHSLEIVRGTLPPCLEVAAESDDGTVMAVRHTEHPVRGVQFHPESILTPAGNRLMTNWLGML
ncbi:MAG TPA: aminodeoxychorismate/anthranilate synthase component II [Bacteroidota bacterium]|nr:aminodeoxychorismate/anthranilate synthase component II [Bacteroidota bacterium]